MELFSTRAYEEIWVEEIAERAGISRGLLYHYFPTKRDFYVAVTRAAAAEAAKLTAPDPALPIDAQLREGIDAFLRYAQEHSHGFLTAYRGSLAGDPEVRAIVEHSRERQAARIIERVTGKRKPPALLELAIRGWTAMAQAVTAQWLVDGQPEREAVHGLLVRSLIGVLSAAAEPGGRQAGRGG